MVQELGKESSLSAVQQNSAARARGSAAVSSDTEQSSKLDSEVEHGRAKAPDP